MGAQAVIANLLISHLEIRTENCEDIRSFSHQRDIETVVVRLGPQLSAFKEHLCDIARGPLQRLCKNGALWSHSDRPNPEAFAKFTLVKAREAYSRDHNKDNPFSAGMVNRDFRTAICLAHALELLVQYGLRPVYHFLLTNLGSGRNDSELAQVPGVQEVVTDIGNIFGVESAVVQSQIPFVAGHPKLFKLRDILVDHFSTSLARPASSACYSQTSQTTRAIVFTQFRDSVMEIMHMLKKNAPLLRPAVFVGQSAGSSPGQNVIKKKTTQRDQLRVIHDFREGCINILISTCIGEEGLDVGQVDLIVCFDAYKSPVRLIQRLGRTGRKRSGRVVVLLTEGREQNNFAQSMARSSTVHESLLRGQTLKQFSFYPHNPRMVPLGLDPIPVAWVPAPQHTVDKLVNFGDYEVTSLREAILANWRKYKLDSVSFNHKRFSPAPLISSKAQIGTQSSNTFTSNHTCINLPSIRENFQFGACTKQDSLGPSLVTWNTVASLRLIELHRRGITHAMYHATGLRTVDMSRSLSELLPCESSQLTRAPEASIFVKPTSTKKRPLPAIASVKLIRGLVSGAFMVDPTCTSVPKWENPSVNRPITLEGLNQAFANLIESVPQPPIEVATEFSTCSTEPKPPGSASMIFDAAFGLPAPLFYSSSPQCKRRRLESGTGASPSALFPSALLVQPSPIPPRNAVVLGSAGHLIFDSRLQFDDAMSDFLQPTQDDTP